MNFLRQTIDERLQDVRPSSVIGMTLVSCALIVVLRYLQTIGIRNAWTQLLGNIMRIATRLVPGVSSAIEREKNKMLEKIEHALPVASDGEAPVVRLPDEGISPVELLARLERLSEREKRRVKERKLSGTIYMFDEEHEKLMAETLARFLHVNTLHGDVFASGRKLESDIVRMTLHMLHGTSAEHCGLLTSGGTESILMAVKAYRDRAVAANALTGGNGSSSTNVYEIVASTTVHAAFNKACQYFGLKLVQVEPDPNTFELRVSDVRKHVTRNTILLVASAPCFPQGTIDPVRQLGELALQYKLGLHVDACLGGFVLPFARELGYTDEVQQFDFAVPGVTSMSADTHKYGLSCKGTSVLMFSSRQLRRHMYFVAPTWTGGIYGSPSIAGSRPGAPIAATWASMMHMGKRGYLDQADRIFKCAKEMRHGIETSIPELVLQGEQLSMVVAFTSRNKSQLDIFMVNDAMSERGWSLNALQYPKGVHYAITGNTFDQVAQFLQDLKSSVQEVKEHPERFKKGLAPVYGAAIALPDKQLVVELTESFIDALVDGPRQK